MVLKRINGNSGALMLLKRYYGSSTLSCRVNGSPKPSKLLSDYFKLGNIDDAEKLFEEMPSKNVVSWSVVIHGYAINGLNRKSFETFKAMRLSCLVPNSFSVVGLLVNVASLKDLKFACAVHGFIMITGLDSDLIVSTSLLDSYAKCGNAFDSYRVFNELKNPSLVSCNAVLAGFVNNGLFEKSLELFNKFRLSLIPNASTVLSLIRGSVGLESIEHCESLHVLLLKLGLDFDIAVSNSLLDMYSKFMDLGSTSKVFEEMEYKDVISWTMMMSLLIEVERPCDAIKLFHKMRLSGIGYDAIVFLKLVSACTMLGDLLIGKHVHATVITSGFRLNSSNLHLSNSIATMYMKCDDLASSRAVFDRITEKSLVSWTTMILGYASSGLSIEAVDLLTKARFEETDLLDSVILVAALTASADLAALELCMQLHCYAFTLGFPTYRTVQNTLISAYAKCGNVVKAKNVFDDMGSSSSFRDVVSWNAIINGYGLNGFGETAISVFHEMKKSGQDPDSATYLCVLSACSHTGLLSDGLMVFGEMMKDNKLRPSEEHFGCVVDMLVRAGYISDAIEFGRKYFEETSSSIWRTILNACVMDHGYVEYVAKMGSVDDFKQSGQAVVLSNLYASIGRFEDAEELRLNMRDKGLMKNPGTSLLSVISCDYR